MAYFDLYQDAAEVLLLLKARFSESGSNPLAANLLWWMGGSLASEFSCVGKRQCDTSAVLLYVSFATFQGAILGHR